GIEDLGVDTVCTLFLDARGWYVPPLGDVLPLHPRRTLLRRQSGAGVVPEVQRVEGAFHDPGVALLEALHPRGPVLELGRQPRRPEVGRLVDVGVGRDQRVVLRHDAILSMIYSTGPEADPRGSES